MEAKNEQELEDAKDVQENAARCRAMLAAVAAVFRPMRIRLSQLRVDHSYQRPEDPPWRRTEMVDEFDPYAFGVIYVGRRKNGTFWIDDGQQRCATLRAMAEFAGDDGQGTPDPLVRCSVFDSRGPKHEAEVFYKMNMLRTSPKPHEAFKSAVRGRVEPQASIASFIGLLGLSIGAQSSHSPRVMSFAIALTKTWADHENACKRAVRIQRTIVGNSGVMIAEIHKGLYRILSRGGVLSAKDVAHLRVEGKDAIRAAISGVQKANGTAARRPHKDDCAEGILVLLGRTIALRRGRVTVCKTS